MLRGVILSIFSIMSLSLPVIAEAQSQYPTQTSAIKNDGRFIAKLGTDERQDVISANGLVQSLNVEIEWWSLIGQAVEIYGIKWERGRSYNLGGGKTLQRSSLGEYPDLVDRFDDLKPISIEVSFSAEMFSEGYEDGRKYNKAYNNSLGQNYYKSGRVTAKKTTDNFLIAESGKMMRDFSPSSPQDWQSFITFNTSEITSNVSDRNIATHNTFKAAQRVVFTNLRISKIDLPDASARAIYDEYIERKKKEKAKKDCEEINICDGKEEDTSKDDEDDFWGDEDSSTETSSNANENDDFWGSSVKSAKNNSKPQDDFWGETKENSVSNLDTNFEITKNKSGQQGVISNTGDVLIPFNDWAILAFEDGLATVKQETIASRRCRGFVSLGWKTTIVGDVDRSGTWVVEAQKEAIVIIEQHSPFSEWRTYSRHSTEPESYYVDYCKELRRAKSTELKSEGFSVKEDWIKDFDYSWEW